MHISFLYYDDCPSHGEALARLYTVLNEEGIAAAVDVIRVETGEQAQQLRFTGSPTIRINGEDIDPPPPDARYGLTCRAYRREDGRVTPLPTAGLIREGLRRQMAASDLLLTPKEDRTDG